MSRDKPLGRPTRALLAARQAAGTGPEYTPPAPPDVPRATRERVLDAIASGSTVTALVELGVVESESVVYRLARRDPEFGEDFQEAQALGVQSRVDRMHHAADSLTAAELPVRREQLKHWRWEASKRMPEIYGDRVQQDTRAELQVDLGEHLTGLLARALERTAPGVEPGQGQEPEPIDITPGQGQGQGQHEQGEGAALPRGLPREDVTGWDG